VFGRDLRDAAGGPADAALLVLSCSPTPHEVPVPVHERDHFLRIRRGLPALLRSYDALAELHAFGTA